MSECNFGEPRALYASVIPAILEGGRSDTFPCFCCHRHCLEEVNFIDILLIGIISLNGTKAEPASIEGFEAANDSSIEGLYMRCETRRKVYEGYTLGCIVNGMTGKVVQSESDVAVLQLQFDIPLLNPPKCNSVTEECI